MFRLLGSSSKTIIVFMINASRQFGREPLWKRRGEWRYGVMSLDQSLNEP